MTTLAGTRIEEAVKAQPNGDRNRAECKFRSIDIHEPIWVLTAVAETAWEMVECLAELQDPRETPLTLVLHIPDQLTEDHVGGLLAVAAALADRLVLTADERGPQAWGQLALHDLGKHCQAKKPQLVFIESHPRRAVVAAMQGLAAGETFAVIWPADHGLDAISGLVIQGARWRATQETTEGDEFHFLPPQEGTP